MKLSVFAVYDKAVQAYLQPFYSRTKGEALRSFSEACNQADHNFHKHAADYSLMFLGEYDDHSGTFDASDPVRVISAFECLDDVSLAERNGERQSSSGQKLPM